MRGKLLNREVEIARRSESRLSTNISARERAAACRSVSHAATPHDDDDAHRAHRVAARDDAPRRERERRRPRRGHRDPSQPRPRVLRRTRRSRSGGEDIAARGVQGGPPAPIVAPGAAVDGADLVGTPRVRLPQLPHPGRMRPSRRARHERRPGWHETSDGRGPKDGRDVPVSATHQLRTLPPP